MARLTDMEELLARIPNSLVRDYMREAMNCYMAGAYRGAVVLSYIALFDDLLIKLGEIAPVNSKAKKIYDEALKKKNNQDVYESYLIDQLKATNLVSELDADFLEILRTLRNKSAHPSGHKPSPEEARYVFFEAIDRVLSKPILSTTYVVDEVTGRLANGNFFPSKALADIKSVVSDEVASLHESAMPHLVAKLCASVVSTDQTTATNSIYFLIGLAGQDTPASNTAIQKQFIAKTADDTNYRDVILQVLSANGKLLNGLSLAIVARIRAAISAKIATVTALTKETSLVHPTTVLESIAKAIPEDELLPKFKPALQELFEKRAHSELVAKMVSKRPSLVPLYVQALIARAGSADFGVANSVSNALEALDKVLGGLLSDENALHLIVAVCKAAEHGAFDAIAIRDTKFAGIPLVKAKALSFIDSDKSAAESYVEKTLGEDLDEFVSSNLNIDEAI